MNILRHVITKLNTPVPLPGILTAEIHIPILSDPIPLPGFLTGLGRREARAKKLRKKAEQKAAQKAPSTYAFALEGSIRAGNATPYSLNGYDLKTNAETWIFGEIKIGGHAKVKGIILNGHERLCTSIVMVGQKR
jgi:hypothetical protein